ncbi:hypothetical protein L7F22_017365 [Adiantum nelumboides]|nr:hypothetical protein [Adiantum nelumboides]
MTKIYALEVGQARSLVNAHNSFQIPPSGALTDINEGHYCHAVFAQLSQLAFNQGYGEAKDDLRTSERPAAAAAMADTRKLAGQQEIAIEDVSCEVIVGTEDVQAIETTEKDPFNPHLNQIVYKDDDKETQASEGQPTTVLP